MAQRRLPLRPSERMSWAPLWGQMVVLEDEVVMAYGEDIKHCFHIFAPGPAWRGYFVISKAASGHCFKDGSTSPGRPRVRSAPMGWSNIVDFVQSSLERMGTFAGIPAARTVKMGEPSPLLELRNPRDYFSFYVDNFDGFKVVAANDIASYEGRPSEEQLNLQEVFRVWGVETDPKKSTSGTLRWQSLGAEQHGEFGLVGSARSFRRGLLGASFWLLGRASELRGSSQDLLSLIGKHMHSVQFARPLACCFDETYKVINSPTHLKGLPLPVLDEVCMLSGFLPLHWIDQKMDLSGVCYATDASEDGGGACCTIGLSGRGKAKCRLACCEHQDLEGGAADPIVLIEAFGGMGGLRKAIELLGIMPQGIIFIDSDPLCLKLAKKHSAFVMVVDDIKKVDRNMVLSWRRMFPRATKGGWPCVNHSALNKRRKGAEAPSSRLLDDMLRIAEDLKSCSGAAKLSNWEVLELYENVMMDDADLSRQSEAIGEAPVFVEAGQVHWCRRPRLYWMKGFAAVEGQDLKFGMRPNLGTEGSNIQLIQAVLTAQRPPLEWFLRDNSEKLANPEEPFYTFARPRPKPSEPEDAAGKERCSDRTLGRWRGDSWRLAPYQYSDANMIRTQHGIRRPLGDEQLRMLGFNSDHFQIKQKLSEDQQQQMTGNSWAIIVVARLLAGLAIDRQHFAARNIVEDLWQVWRALEDRVQQLKQTRGLHRRWLLLRLILMARLSEEQLLVYLLSRSVSHRGSDVRMDTGIPFCASDFARRSVDPTLWGWKVLMAYKWKAKGHINQLEAIAVLDLLKKLSRTKEVQNKRLFLMVDNTTVLNILAKGRTSSNQLQPVLRRLTAVLMTCSLRLVLAWVKGEYNPADGPSRWVEVSLFIEELWECGDPQNWASDCLSGLGHFIPAAKPHLIGSWRLHAAWSRAELPCRAPPFTPLVLYALAHQAVANSWTDIAVLLILGFHTFARAGELFQCKVGDFTFDHRAGTWTLPLSKSGQRAGATESLLITDPFVVTLVKNFCRDKLPGDRLATASPNLLRKRFGLLLEQLGLTYPYRWYSVRRGGATHGYRTTNNIAAICVRGRWNAVKTAKIYICDGVAQLSELTLTPAKQRRLRQLAVACRPDFEQCS
eukprot:Skav201090  [mRNA]  locus=scaffold2562:77913:81556:+ [translate_table: standard]